RLGSGDLDFQARAESSRGNSTLVDRATAYANGVRADADYTGFAGFVGADTDVYGDVMAGREFVAGDRERRRARVERVSVASVTEVLDASAGPVADYWRG
ncbi:hypothetical protein CN359_30995, partial [Bacillus thuringiensis]